MTPKTSVPAIRNRPDLLKRLAGSDSSFEPVLPAVTETPEDTFEILIFQIGAERYGMEIHKIVQIIRYQEPAPVPHTVAFLDGIISLRGQMIPVINGRKRLRHPEVLHGKKSRIIVVKDELEYQGILVDSTHQVIRIARSSIEPVPPVVSGIQSEFMDGVCYQKGTLIILLNLDRFLQLV